MATSHCALCECPTFSYADCVDGGRVDLARKILAAVEAEERSRFGESAHGVSGAIRELLQREGVNVQPEASDGTE